MKHVEPRAAVLALAVLFTAPVVAAAPRGAVLADQTCRFDFGRPVSCHVAAVAAPDGTVSVTYSAPGQRMEFRGSTSGAWRSGRLNTAPAMGYELNRGHVVYSTLDLKSALESWSPGLQHGSY